jgi:hypothetical protein
MRYAAIPERAGRQSQSSVYANPFDAARLSHRCIPAASNSFSFGAYCGIGCDHGSCGIRSDLPKIRRGAIHIQPSVGAELIGYVFTFLLGIYGGFFSGGYITILTAVYVAFVRLSFLEAIATTKLINVVSSAIATGVFIWHGLVDYLLGLILGVTAFVGALVGARLAIRVGNEWLRRIFYTAVWLLGLKVLFFDLLGYRAGCNASAHVSE